MKGLPGGCRGAGELREAQDEDGEKAALTLQDFLDHGQEYAFYVPQNGTVIKSLTKQEVK